MISAHLPGVFPGEHLEPVRRQIGLRLNADAVTLAAAVDAEAAQTTVMQSGDGAEWTLVGERYVVPGQIYTLTRTSGSLPTDPRFGLFSFEFRISRFWGNSRSCRSPRRL